MSRGVGEHDMNIHKHSRGFIYSKHWLRIPAKFILKKKSCFDEALNIIRYLPFLHQWNFPNGLIQLR